MDDDWDTILRQFIPKLEAASDARGYELAVAELATHVSPLSVLEDESLWRAARAHLAPADARRLEELHQKRQREGLEDAKARELAPLVRQ